MIYAEADTGEGDSRNGPSCERHDIPRKKIKIEVLRNGLSEILRQRKRVMCNL